ncbi:response regulator transcription factor [Micromonospora robiginosa]|uniref:LuxR C-terminal-related transcriptional regulator n=1 Tax=Micromonospora robiginosa TaxID=2749844 RepID=A0AAF0SXG4_9ACTN|nr:LuxR C-terminal-related transcriptional regulator [Micromonospora ferruginea]WMF04645.1 LuxR C-terminal-related transcriptional regulator [Micromonospora ferruginea]
MPAFSGSPAGDSGRPGPAAGWPTPSRLHLGVTTVKTHVSAAMEKLELRNRVQAAVVAHRLGLVDDGFNPVPDPGGP